MHPSPWNKNSKLTVLPKNNKSKKFNLKQKKSRFYKTTPNRYAHQILLWALLISTYEAAKLRLGKFINASNWTLRFKDNDLTAPDFSICFQVFPFKNRFITYFIYKKNMVFFFYIYIYLKRSPPCLYRSQSLEYVDK
jgi:hypothetical protein